MLFYDIRIQRFVHILWTNFNSIKTIIALILLCSSFNLLAQNNKNVSIRQCAWQQKVDFEIDAILYDSLKTLDATVQMNYQNNSPFKLDSLYIHLWANAYSNKKTPYAIQQDQNGSSQFYEAREDELGGFEKINFLVDGKNCQWEYTDKSHEIVLIVLKNPLESGDELTINVPYTLKIPNTFSRMGVTNFNFQLTQWFPKPAVFDINGWNTMPYLDQGEFYSEFGNYKVDISVPNNYVVAASGELINSKILPDSLTVNGIKTKYKKYSFALNNTHDFAFFASKNYIISKGKVIINQDTINTFVYTLSKAKEDHLAAIEKTLRYYSQKIGQYPYSTCSVVQGDLKAGAGMEYPTITVISNLNEEVIVHEVGHNWFYGILANNERLYPWMDESINTFFESEAIHGNYSTPKKVSMANINDIGMKMMAQWGIESGLGQAPNTASEDLTNINYGTMVYGRGAENFQALKDHLGEDVFYLCFQNYFEEWKFKHPLPGDMKSSFEQTSGKDLSWFFDVLLAENYAVDYQLKKARFKEDTITLNLNNNDTNKIPLQIGFFNKSGELLRIIEISGFTGYKQLKYNFNSKNDSIKVVYSNISIDDQTVPKEFSTPKSVQLDPKNILFDYRSWNNSKRVNGIKPISLGFVTGINDYKQNNLYLTPLLGWNEIDRVMVGLGLSNFSLPERKFNWYAFPILSFEQKQLNGFAGFSVKNIPTHGMFRKIEWGVKSKRFSEYNLFADNGIHHDYGRIVPYIEFDFRKKHSRSTKNSKLMLRNNTILTQSSRTRDMNISHLGYYFRDTRGINPYSAQVNIYYGQSIEGNTDVNFSRIDIEARHKFQYKSHKKGFNIRAFGGFLPFRTQNNGLENWAYSIGAATTQYDFMRDRTVFGRGASQGLFQNQVLMSDDQHKFVSGLTTMRNSAYLFALNLELEAPFKLPISLFSDISTFENINKLNSKEVYFFNGGLKLGGNRFAIYIPLFSNSYVDDQETRYIEKYSNTDKPFESFLKQMTFSLNFDIFDPYNTLEFVKFQ